MAKKTIPKQTSSTPPVKLPPRLPKKPKAQLPFPIIAFAANNSVLYPIDAIDGTWATLTLPTGATDRRFFMAIKGQVEPAFDPVLVDDDEDVVPIAAPSLSLMIGHTVLMWYTARVEGKEKTSLVLELEVQHIREVHLAGSRPEFVHAEYEWSTWWLWMSDFEGDETITIDAWPMIQPGQRLFVTVAGDQHQAPYPFIWVVYDHVVTEAEAHAEHVFELELSRRWMSQRQDYSALTIHFGVIWDGTEPVPPDPGDPHLENPLPTNAQDFHLRTTTLLRVDPGLDLPPPHLRESTECTPGHWVLNPVNSASGGHADVTYDWIAPGDHVCAYASGPGLETQPLGCKDVKKGETSLAFEVVPWIIAALFNQTLTLTYTVSSNGSDPQHSPERVIKVLEPLLTVPEIAEATAGIVDLNTFNGNATGVVPIWEYAARGECCWMWITGTLEGGGAYRFDVFEDEPLTSEWLHDGVNTPISRADLQTLADCSDFVLHFAASFDGQCERATAIEFPSRTFTMVQEDLVLVAPTVREAVGNQLTIYNGREGVTVRVKYPSISDHQQIRVCWKRTDGTCLPLASQPGNHALGHVDFSIPREAVIEAAGETVTINYTVTSACKLATSECLALHISLPVRLPTPGVPQATPPATQGGILDLRTFAGDASITVEKWWFILLGQVGWLECRGTQEDGSSYTIHVMVNQPINANDLANGLSRVLKRDELNKLRNRTPLDVVFKCTTKVGGHAGNAVEFPLLHLAFRKAFYDYTDFDPDGKGWNGWQRGLGAASPADLVHEHEAGLPPGPNPVHFLKDWGYTDTRDPATQSEKMYKEFNELEQGRTYTFRARVRDSYGFAYKPRLVLLANGTEISPIVEPGLAWQFIEGVFTARSTSTRLSFDNRRMGIAPGNDYDVESFLIEEV
ncbi:hypothetical protein QCBJ_27210 [Pseudomonas sp. QC2]|uniref:hypothetical protein n=1 Tax=Pseudomonas sp. QC2 TaxID=2065822 RepID=UPI000C7ACEA3|nr:hypothetical protein [Pseudomonas sp. QC2]PLR60150.1 hypothetical protein QCBJ_27210 [Pseudomonas sp. QC2]